MGDDGTDAELSGNLGGEPGVQGGGEVRVGGFGYVGDAVGLLAVIG